MPLPGLTRVRLGDFKSHHEQELDLEALTLIVGRNGSGKSNVLDALSLLALLADERDINDLERGDQEVAGLRGGLSGAAPFGSSTIRVGCRAESDDGAILDFDVELDAGEKPEIVKETLVLRQRNGRVVSLLDAQRTAAGSGISNASVYSGRAPRTYQFLSSRLAVAQAVSKVAEDTEARRRLVHLCKQLVASLRGVFVLDPVPAQMREYVRIGSPPDRSGASVSAVVYALREDGDAWARLNELVGGLVETDLQGLTFSEARLPDHRLVDVMVAMEERAGERSYTAPARVMSDGTLRYLAIVASLLSLRSEQPVPTMPARRTLVIEEIENGLFPSQGARVLNLLKSEALAQDIRLVCTTHSPALLDALRPEDHRGVVVCDRGPDGTSRLTALVDHPNYIDLAGAGAVGRAITDGRLELSTSRPPSLAQLFS